MSFYQNHIGNYNHILALTSGPKAGIAKGGFTLLLIVDQSVIHSGNQSLLNLATSPPRPISQSHLSPLPLRVFEKGNSVGKSRCSRVHTPVVFPPKNIDSTQISSCKPSQAT